MGGCSSKPKTAEFDGAMEMLEEKPQDEAASKSVEAERICVDAGLKNIDKEQEASEYDIQNTIVEVEHKYLCNMLAEAKEHICAGYDVEGESKVLNDYMNVKQLVGKKINGNLTAVKEKIEKGSKILGPAGCDLPEDSILTKVSIPELKETTAISTIKAGTPSSLEEPSSKRSFEMQVQPVMSEYETSAAQKHISHRTGASHYQQADSNTLGNDVCTESKKMMLAQKSICTESKKMMVSQKSIALGETDLKMPNYSSEEARKRAPTLEFQEVGYRKEVVDLEPPKESTGAVTSDNNWYILEKVEVQNNDLSTLVTNHGGLPRTGYDDPREKSRDAVICDFKVLSTSEVLVASEEKPGAHVLDPLGLAFKNILAQELSAPDIDDVLEKLASEFERQESLACSNS